MLCTEPCIRTELFQATGWHLLTPMDQSPSIKIVNKLVLCHQIEADLQALERAAGMRGNPDDFNGRNPDTGKLEDDVEDGISVYSGGGKSNQSGVSNTSRLSAAVAERYRQKKLNSRKPDGSPGNQ